MSAGGRVIEAGIGPWSLSADGSALVRQEHGYAEGWPRESGSWSPAERIEVRPGPSVRVTLVGESVARGFLLDPVVTLADLCRDAFKRVGADIELVDLAVNNLSPQGAVKLCRAAIELGSAAIVLYVGNNFLRSTPWLEPDQRSSTAELFQCGGYPEYLAARRRALVTLAREFRGETERLCTEAGMPLVVVVPAVNLLDWRSPWVVPAWLPAERVAEWAVTREELAALPDEDTSPDLADRRSELADRLAGLDGGSTPRPLEIIGRDMVCCGRDTGGLELLTEAVGVGADPAHYDRRCPLEVATELRLLGATPGFRLVDVPARAQQRWGSRAFGKDVFLDYCHHTSESLGAVAGDIAVEVAAAIGAPVSGVPARSEPDLPADRLAECYLLSALHNQHWGQSAATVQHWIAAALRTDRSSVDNLVSYFAMSVPTALFWLSVASAGGPDALVPQELLPPGRARRRVRGAGAAGPGRRQCGAPGGSGRDLAWVAGRGRRRAEPPGAVLAGAGRAAAPARRLHRGAGADQPLRVRDGRGSVAWAGDRTDPRNRVAHQPVRRDAQWRHVLRGSGDRRMGMPPAHAARRTPGPGRQRTEFSMVTGGTRAAEHGIGDVGARPGTGEPAPGPHRADAADRATTP
jgi:hypothetical protein